ncbi:ABC transporter permease [Paenibacillus aestuarii]|uniref:ABC transporter permease n=1 Tax=Paenibacillus aestuarii TaxID=516965 RepID=A0ABW0K4C7_9BACL|nr:hypothetical protein [Paenibacillus aestuarii]
MKKSEFMATSSLVKLYLGQNKINILLMLFLPMLLAYGSAASFALMFHSPQELRTYIEQAAASPVSLGMLGHVLSDTLGGVTVWRIRVSTLLFAAIFNIVFAIKNSRKEEESGRLELLRSGNVGRKASLTAVIVLACMANIIGGLLMAGGLMAAGLPALGSLAAGLATGLCSCFFAAVACAAAQVASSARAASAIAYAILGCFVVFQAIGNFQSSPGGIFYLSPFTWETMARPYAGENFGVFVIALILIAMVLIAAYVLLGKRDLGAGLLPDRSGSANAKASFNNVFALSWRLHSGMLIAWITGFALFGALLGSLAPVIQSMFNDSAALAGWITGLGGTGRAFLLFMIYVLAQVASAYSILTTLRLYSEENEMRAEPLLASTVSRVRWAASHLLYTFAGTALIIAAMGIGAGITLSAVTHNSSEVVHVVCASLAKIPAVWVVAALAVFVYGLIPKLTAGMSWTLLGMFFIVEFLWELHIASVAAFRISPFSYVYPTSSIAAAPIILLTLIAAGLTTAGMIGLRFREIGH